jgi:pimeloyl-ACP methyl ester carboxylesterase
VAVAPPPAPRGVADFSAAAPRVRGRLAAEAMFPAGLAGYRTRFETLATGERVRVIESGPEHGEPVVCFPGWGCPVWDFHSTIPALAAEGYRAIAVDLRGHGLSDMPVDPDRYTTDAMVEHGVAILDALHLRRAVLIGHSMGGALAIHLALRVPERVRGLALFSPIGCGTARAPEIGRMLSPEWSIPMLRGILRRSAVAAGLRILYRRNALVTARNVDEYWAPSQFDGFVPAMRALLHKFRWTCFDTHEMSRITVPGLLVRGAHDPVISRRDSMPVPSGWREMVIEDAGHLPHDEAPDTVNRAVVELLSRITTLS